LENNNKLMKEMIVYDITLRTPSGETVTFSSNIAMMISNRINQMTPEQKPNDLDTLLSSFLTMYYSVKYNRRFCGPQTFTGGSYNQALVDMLGEPSFESRPYTQSGPGLVWAFKYVPIESLEEICYKLSRSVWRGRRESITIDVPFSYEVVRNFMWILYMGSLRQVFTGYTNSIEYGFQEGCDGLYDDRYDYLRQHIWSISLEVQIGLYQLAQFLECPLVVFSIFDSLTSSGAFSNIETYHHAKRMGCHDIMSIVRHRIGLEDE